MLTKEQIDKLASGKGVRRIAVENFLGSLGGSDRMGASMNLHADAKCYKWNAATVNAIRKGINLL